MTEKNAGYRYIYGPVASWRLGSSLGIDPISRREKICGFDCVYCQLGKTDVFTPQRKVFVKTEDIIAEIKKLPDVRIDYITFSGRGEPTLAANLKQLIQAIRKIRKEKIAVLTNSTLLDRPPVREALNYADFIQAKLDAASDKVFREVNKPRPGWKIEKIIQGIKNFRNCYTGKFALQIMFVKENKHEAPSLARIAREIRADEIELNTPLRPCAATPLSQAEMAEIGKEFSGLKIRDVYQAYPKAVSPLSSEDTLKRRGKF